MNGNTAIKRKRNNELIDSSSESMNQSNKLGRIKVKLEKHYRREINLLYEVLQLNDEETRELLEWFKTNSTYLGLKGVVDEIRKRGKGKEEAD